MAFDELISSDASEIKDRILDAGQKGLEDDFSSLTISAADRPPGEHEVDDNLVDISDRGDLILVATGSKSAAKPFLFRVDCEQLKGISPFFKVLLGDDRFKEGALLRATHDTLREEGFQPSEAPANKLPRITIAEMGQIVPSTPGTEHLTHDFLRILHGLGISCAAPTINYLAGLASLADRFDCLPAVSKFVKERGLILGRERRKKSNVQAETNEQGYRQRILVGWLFDYPVWFRKGTHQLIMQGSRYWSDAGDSFRRDQRLWWNLPDGIEEELQFRRERILETINSLQTHLISLYTSRKRQCSLGYDTSPQCDSFQLGEAIRFFNRIGTLRVQGLIYDLEPPDSRPKSIKDLIQTMRQCPRYQIDRNHSHCGVRTKLIPRLHKIESALAPDVGLNRAGWKSHRAEESWSEPTPTEQWVMSRDYSDWWFTGDPSRQGSIKSFFTASIKDWN